MYAIAEFNNNLTFDKGVYWVKPIFEKAPDYKPLFNNYNIAERNYQSLRRRLAKDKRWKNRIKPKLINLSK